MSRVESVPCAAAHSRASSISPPAISADATRWSGAAGRGVTVIMGDRAWWRPSAKGAQELRRLHKHLGLRRHRWHCGTGLLGKTSDRRDAHRPRSAFHIATVPLCHLLALGRHDATTGRSARGASACSWHVLGGDNKGEVDKVTQAVLPRPRRASRARAGAPSGSARASCPTKIARRTSWGPCGAKKGLLGRHRPFRAVRHFQRKWATRAPSTLQRS